MNKPKIELHLGDCLEKVKEIPDKSIDLVWTDPPYGKSFLIDEEWAKWFQPVCNDIFRVLKDNSAAYFFIGFNPRYYSAAIKSGFTVKANLIWVKSNFGLGFHFKKQYGQILLCFKGAPLKPDVEINEVICEKKVGRGAMRHNCQKPVNLIKKLIPQYSKEGDTVLDPFMGSGPTGMACKELNRNFIGIEINPVYYEIAKKRISDIQGAPQHKLF